MSDSEPFFLSPRGADASQRRAAIALTIAGSDSGGGAGIQADLKTFSALGVGDGHGPVHHFHAHRPVGA